MQHPSPAAENERLQLIWNWRLFLNSGAHRQCGGGCCTEMRPSNYFLLQRRPRIKPKVSILESSSERDTRVNLRKRRRRRLWTGVWKTEEVFWELTLFCRRSYVLQFQNVCRLITSWSCFFCSSSSEFRAAAEREKKLSVLWTILGSPQLAVQTA